MRVVDLEASHHPVCRRYVDFLIASAYSLPFAVLVAILYGVEVSYLASWSLLETNGPYAEFIERWSNDRFAVYVRGLLDLSEQHPHPDSQQYFDEVLRHERDFWHMTVGG
jgi:thiaminase/transcriptional activator TenA